MEVIHRVHLEKLLETTKGGFFSVRFVKVDGSDRKMLCRTGVRKNLKGGTCKAQRPDTPYKVVWSLGDRAYRLVNLETTYEVRFNHTTYTVKD